MTGATLRRAGFLFSGPGATAGHAGGAHGVSVPASGIFVFWQSKKGRSFSAARWCGFSPGERDFCFLATRPSTRTRRITSFQSRRAGFLFSGRSAHEASTKYPKRFQSRRAGFLFSGAFAGECYNPALEPSVSVPASGIFVFWQEIGAELAKLAADGFSPGERDFCFLATKRAKVALAGLGFQSRRAGFLFSGSRVSTTLRLTCIRFSPGERDFCFLAR